VTIPAKASIARRPFLTSLVRYLALDRGSLEKLSGSKLNSPDALPDPLAWSKMAAPKMISRIETVTNNNLSEHNTKLMK